jgi:hypothetical protein
MNFAAAAPGPGRASSGTPLFLPAEQLHGKRGAQTAQRNRIAELRRGNRARNVCFAGSLRQYWLKTLICESQFD